MLRLSLALLLSPLALAPAAEAQVRLVPDLELVVNGTVQPRVGYAYQEGAASERLGVGLRRARFQTRATYDGTAGLEFDLDAAPGDVRAVDLIGFVNFSDNLTLRAGRWYGAQPRSYIPTSHTRIDAVERAAIAELWAGNTIGSSGRDFGVDLTYETDRSQTVVFLHSGTGSFSRAVGNLRESITAGDVTRGRDETGLALTAMTRYSPEAVPGVEVGAFAGVNGVGNESTELDGVERTYATGGAHAYWGARPGSQPVRVKLDALGIRYEEVAGVRQESVGVSLFGAARVLGHGEVFARGERFWSDVDGPGDDYLTAGLSYSLSAARGAEYRRVRLTAAYHYRASEPRGDAHVVAVQGQFAF